jgi:hypothetical protein
MRKANLKMSIQMNLLIMMKAILLNWIAMIQVTQAVRMIPATQVILLTATAVILAATAATAGNK